MGALRPAERLAFADSADQEGLLQQSALASWADGSVKWLLVDLLLPEIQDHQLWLRPACEPPGPSAGPRVKVEVTASAIAVDTGTAFFELDARRLLPFRRILVNGQEMLDAAGSRMLLTDAKDREAVGEIESCAVEANGPIRATVCLKGRFHGKVRARFVAQLSFYAGTGLVRTTLTLHNPQRAKHSGGLWDLGDPGSMLFRDFSLQLPLAGMQTSRSRVTWTAEPGQAVQTLESGDLEIYQDSSGGENWQSRNHVNRLGKVPCTFRGYRVRTGAGEHRGLRANPVLTVQSGAAAVDVAIPEFWQQFPKALEVQSGSLNVRLFPKQFADLFELQGGEQKTHVVWLQFGGPDRPPLDWVHKPAHVHATPQWYAASGAISYLLPADDDPDSRFHELVSHAVEGPNSFFARREIIDEYGWRNYGDMYADHEAAYYKGPKPVISHYNNQYDVVNGTLLQFFRTGDTRWLELHDALARHVIDIDIYHTELDKAGYCGGLFWHTDHYRDVGTCTHRCYSKANQQPGKPYGGGPCNEHNYTTGLFHYYCRTGDPQARDAVVGMADWVLNMDDGARNVLGIVDGGPTGLASSTTESTYHGPGRGCGNSINALLDAWLLSNQRHYLDKAEELLRRSIHPHDDLAERHLLDVERRWSYTVFLLVLIRYLELKSAAGQQDSMVAYARASLVHYASWMADHEEFYFDRPEKLEFPTETWAAQEIRKANVLRFAARHVGEPLRSRLMERGREFRQRVWTDLARFPTRTATRPIAIMLTEGVKDEYLEANPVGADGPITAIANPDFGRPAAFVRQRQRVQNQARSLGGMLRMATRLLNARHWIQRRRTPAAEIQGHQ